MKVVANENVEFNIYFR